MNEGTRTPVWGFKTDRPITAGEFQNAVWWLIDNGAGTHSAKCTELVLLAMQNPELWDKSHAMRDALEEWHHGVWSETANDRLTRRLQQLYPTRTHTDSDCVVNIVSMLYWGHLRPDFIEWLVKKVDRDQLSIEHGVLIATLG
jgi:hypothetical protein